jgi:MFS family permease
VAQGFFIPAYQSILPEIVEKDYLRSANILSRLSHQVFDLFGPALGGLCIALVGPAGAFALDGVTFIVSIVTLFLMPIASTIKRAEKVEEEEKKPVLFRSHIELFFRDFRAGVSYIATIKWLWISIIVSAFVNVGLEAPIEVALPKLVHDVWGGQVWLLGAILTAYAVGSIIAMIILGQLRDIPHRGCIGYLAFLFACLAIICFGLPLPKQIAPLVAIIANGCIGFGTSIFAVIWATLLQERVSSDKLGRVTSLDWIGSFGLMPLGFLAAGLITDTIGASWTFVMGGLLGVIFILAAFFVRDIRLLQ